jgi:hypothetical protein
MKNFKTDAFIFLSLLILTSVIWIATLGQSSVDIQLHDTYFILDKVSLLVLVIGPLTFLIFLARALTRKFKTKWTNTGLMIGLALIALITYHAINIEQSYLAEMLHLDDEGLVDKGQFVSGMKRMIGWTWVLFCFWLTGLLLLLVRTTRIWKSV